MNRTFKHPSESFSIQGNVKTSSKDVKIPEGLYLIGHLIVPEAHLTIEGNLYASGDVVCAGLYVKGNINCSSIVALDDSVVVSKSIECKSIYSFGDIIAEEYIECENCSAGGVIDCLDIDSNGNPIIAEELVCRTLLED